MAKNRSPNYPSIPLREAIDLAQKVWKREKRTAVSPNVFAAAWGYKSASGPVRSKIGALRQYGLLERRDSGVGISELAVEVVAHPEGSDQRLTALRKAAYRPALFARLLQTHRHASPDALRAHLLTKEGFSDRAATQFAESFRDTLALAKLEESDYRPSDDDSEGDGAEDGDESDSEDAGDSGRSLVKKPPVKPGMNQDVFTLEEGEVVLQLPSRLSRASVEDLESWLGLILRKVKRAVAPESGE